VVAGLLTKPSFLRILWLLLALCGTAVSGLPVLSGQASATIVYQQRPGLPQSFLTAPTGVTVDNSAALSGGDVYVVDGTVLYRFNAAGGLLNEAALGGDFSADRVAVDSSDTASAGDVYITVPGDGLEVIPPNGRIEELNGSTESKLMTLGGLVMPTAIAVDASGNLYVAQSEKEIIESSPMGVLLNVVKGLIKPEGIAVDSRGDLYVASEAGTIKFTQTSKEGFSVAKTIDTEPAFDVAVDSTTGNVFIALGDEVAVFNSSGSKIGVALGSATTNFNTYKAVGESEATGNVYAVNAFSRSVEVAEPEVAEPGPTQTLPTPDALLGTQSPQLGGTPGMAQGAAMQTGVTTASEVPSEVSRSKSHILTSRQKLVKALKICKKKPKKQRDNCEVKVHKIYSTTARKRVKK
jgi:sugar lactone lactonase YvrE